MHFPPLLIGCLRERHCQLRFGVHHGAFSKGKGTPVSDQPSLGFSLSAANQENHQRV